MSLPLDEVLAALEALAPLALAEDWDNVGLLVDGRAGRATDPVDVIALTIDLTEEVLEEAIGAGSRFVVAYHPPIFRPIKRLTRASAHERVLLRAVREGVSVYSPHTALDAAEGGVNDWLADALGPGERGPIVPAAVDAEVGGARGMGRRVTLEEPLPLGDLVGAIKAHLRLEHVRVARSAEHARGVPVESGFVCAGAGGAVFETVRGSGLFLTGEMRHHDVAARVASGSSVVLCDHTNTERGYLPRLAERLSAELRGEVRTHVCRVDKGPLEVV
jgi:dinuclear metal center YbgI/SA1388 family protein